MPYKYCPGDRDITKTKHAVEFSQFGSDATRSDGMAIYCLACAAAKQRRWKTEHREKVQQDKREYRRRQKEARC
jgi:hypothetical protein